MLVSFPGSQLGADGPSLDGQGGWLSVDHGQEDHRAPERQKRQHLESQAELSPSPNTTTGDSPHGRPFRNPYLGPIEPEVGQQPDLAEDIGTPTTHSPDVDTESNSASDNTSLNSGSIEEPEPGGKRKRRASDTEGLPRSNRRPRNSECNRTETGSPGEQRTDSSSSAVSPRSETDRGRRRMEGLSCFPPLHARR